MMSDLWMMKKVKLIDPVELILTFQDVAYYINLQF